MMNIEVIKMTYRVKVKLASGTERHNCSIKGCSCDGDWEITYIRADGEEKIYLCGHHMPDQLARLAR
jgi:hypothetical protein